MDKGVIFLSPLHRKKFTPLIATFWFTLVAYAHNAKSNSSEQGF